MGAETKEKTVKASTDTKKKGDDKVEDELSDEDRQLQEELELCIQRLDESNADLYEPALETMKTLIKSSTTSMTSVPKPLKFMRPHYQKMKTIYEKIQRTPAKILCADIISVLGMTMSENPEYSYDTLNFRLLGKHENIGTWGHEYVRHLSSQIVSTWSEKDFANSTRDGVESVTEESKDQKIQCMALVQQIIPYLMAHNAESEAIDLCIEIEQLDLLLEHSSELNYQRVCLYMTSCIAYLPDPDNSKVLKCACDIYKQFSDYGNALRCALRYDNHELVTSLFSEAGVTNGNNSSSTGQSVQRQLAFLLGKQQFVAPFQDAVVGDDQDLADMLGNARLSEHFLSLARELDIMDPKLPEDIYKSYLEPSRSTIGAPSHDTARTNLAASYVNGLINCGFGKEKLVQSDDTKDVNWLCKQKEYGKMSTVASLGWVLLWDVESGLSQLDKYMFVDDLNTRAGALLGCGVVNSGVTHECDPALALLRTYVVSDLDATSRASIIGMGVAYAGTMKVDALECLTPIILEMENTRFQHACLAALSAGLISVGSLNDEVTSTIIQTMLMRPVEQWTTPFAKFMALGLALTCFGRQEAAEVILASLEAVAEPMKSMAHMMCDFCAYAGTGNVLKIQNLLHILSEKYEEKPSKESGKDKGTSDAKSSTKNEGTSVKDKSSKASKSGTAAKDAPGSAGTRTRGRRAASGNSDGGASVSESPGTRRSARQAAAAESKEVTTDDDKDKVKTEAEPMDTEETGKTDESSPSVPSTRRSSAKKASSSTPSSGKRTTSGKKASEESISSATGGKKNSKSKSKSGEDNTETTKDGMKTVTIKEDGMDVDDAEAAKDEAEPQFNFHAHQGLAALGVAVIAMGEEIGLDMVYRMFGHLLRYGEAQIKQAVPLALAMCYVSNPQLKVLDMLSKFSHDSDPELSYNSILAMGIVGAGTNNARLAAMLRQLAIYHTRDPYNLFLVRLAQGLTHLGKGTLTLSPWHSDRNLLRPVSVAGLLILLVSCLDMRVTFMSRHDYLMFYLTPAIQPRLLMTLDETTLKPLPVTVRVGQAVDVVGQAGKPKTITGFQTHTTPVLLSHGERGELATDEYLPVTNLPLEGFILLKKNPEFESTATK